MFENFLRSGPFRGIELKHSRNKIDGIGRGVRFEPVFDVLDFKLAD